MFLYIIFAYIIFNIIIIIAYKKSGSRKVEQLFIIQAISTGIIYGIIFPPFAVSDEFTHFMNGYHIANIIQNKNDEKTEKVQGLFDVYEIQIRDTDERLFSENYVYYDFSPDLILSMKIGETPVFERESDYIIKEQVITRYFSFPQYTLMGLAITVGRVLCLSPLYLVWFTRIINMIAYTIICAFSIKITPFAKYLFYIIMLLPVGMYNICSTSYHTILYAETFFLFAFVLYLKCKEGNILLREWIVLLCLFFVIAPAKGVFLFYFILSFLIPKDKFISKLKYILFLTSSFVVSLISWLGYNLYSYNVMNSISETVNYNNIESVSLNFGSIMEMAQTFLRNMGKTIFARGLYIDRSIFQIKFDVGNLAFIIGFFILVVVAIFSDSEYGFKNEKKEKTVIALTYFLSYGLLSFVGFIAMKMTKQTDIIELKGTYVYQFLPLIGLLLRTKINLPIKTENCQIFLGIMIAFMHTAAFLNLAYGVGLL